MKGLSVFSYTPSLSNSYMDKKITIAQIKEVAQQAYDLYKTNTDGKNADYIPYLANINKIYSESVFAF